MKLAIAAGGTGGHLFPGIAVVEFLQDLGESEGLFIGSDRELEEQILKKENIRHVVLKVGRIKGENMLGRLRTFLTLPAMTWRARRVLAAFGPQMVLGIGGYSSGPVILAALSLGIPRAILEPNAIPGLTNRLLGHFVQRIFVAFREAERFFPARKVRLTGTPVRKKLSDLRAVSSSHFTLLVLGGSQGAHSINQAVINALPLLEKSGKSISVIHQTGMNDFRWVQEAYRASLVPHEVHPFIKEMDQAYARADLIISRAGASTLAELQATCIPSLLIPYPFAADDHQRFNALHLVEAGGAEMIPDAQLTGEFLARRILHFEANRHLLREMKNNLEKLGGRKAAERVAQECYELAQTA